MWIDIVQYWLKTGAGLLGSALNATSAFFDIFKNAAS